MITCIESKVETTGVLAKLVELKEKYISNEEVKYADFEYVGGKDDKIVETCELYRDGAVYGVAQVVIQQTDKRPLATLILVVEEKPIDIAEGYALLQ